MAYKKDNESSESLLDRDSRTEETNSTSKWQNQNQRRPWVWTVMNICLFITSISVYAAVYLKDGDSEIERMKKCSFYCTFLYLLLVLFLLRLISL